MKDEIMTDVRKIREEYAAEHSYDLDAICKDLKDKEASTKRKLVDLSKLKKLQRTHDVE